MLRQSFRKIIFQRLYMFDLLKESVILSEYYMHFRLEHFVIALHSLVFICKM